MVKCQVESVFKNTYFLCRDLETKRQGIITWKNYSRSYFNLKKDVYLGKIIDAEIMSEGKNDMLKLSRVGALIKRRQEKIDYFKNSLEAQGVKDIYAEELYGRRIYRDLSKLIPFSDALPATDALVVGYDNNYIYLEIEELDILGVLPINYLSWYRIKDTSKLKFYIGQTVNIKIVGYESTVKIIDNAGNVHKVRDCFICSTALIDIPDYEKLNSLEGMEVIAKVVASNSTGSILRNSDIPVDLYSKQFIKVGSLVEGKIKRVDEKRNVIDLE